MCYRYLFSALSWMYDVNASTNYEMPVLLVQWLQLPQPDDAWCHDDLFIFHKPTGICSSASTPSLLGVAAQCLHMEFVCFTWSNSCGRNSHTFFLDVCKALDESTLCVSTLILSCVYTWGLVHAVVLVIDFMSIKESLCDSSIYKLPKC